MNLKPQHNIILMQLLRSILLTENELAMAIATATNTKTVDVVPQIGVLLTELKNFGLIWCGQLFNGNGVSMWAAALTMNGRNIGKELAR